MRRSSMTPIFITLGVVALLALGGVVGIIVAAWPVGARRAGTDLVLVNHGASLRNVEIVVNAGDQRRTLHLDRLPSGETLLSPESLPAAASEVTGVSVSGSRLGVSWTHHAALRLDVNVPLRSATGGE